MINAYLTNTNHPSSLKDTDPGPTTTVAVDLCTEGSQDDDEVVIAELTLPMPVRSAVSTILNSENNNEEFRKLVDPKYQEIDQVNFKCTLWSP